MSGEQGITQELSLGQVASKTFQLYRQGFTKYLVPFLIVEAIIGIVTTAIRSAISVPGITSASQQSVVSMSGLVGDLFAVIAVSFIVTLIFYPIAVASAVKLASEQIQGAELDMMGSIRFAARKLVWIWAVTIVLAVIVFLGLIALAVPGIILAIMFSLALPAVILESPGVLGSLSRSRQLVSKRWLKTFVLLLLFGIILLIGSVIVDAIGGLFGVASTLVSAVLSAFFLPLLPIVITVYYYSNLARIAPPQASQEPTIITPGASGPQAGMKYCANCGAQLVSTASFCPNCGAKQAT